MHTKILIIRFSSIGDIVLTTPVVRCLKQQLEGEVEIHYLTKHQYAPILESNPYISVVHTIKHSAEEVMPTLKEEKFDYVIDLHHNLRSSVVKRQLKMLAFTVDKINIQKWVMVNFKINRLPDKHIVDRYLETAKSLGIKNDGKGLDYFIPEKDEVRLSSLPATHQKGYIAFAIGAAHETKSLAVNKLVAICERLEQPIVLLGDDNDKETGDLVVSCVGELVYNACGAYNINQSASLIWQSQKVITHDTGLMHIAAAFQKDIVSIWGNTIPAFGMYPYYPNGNAKSTLIQMENLRCRPCSKIGYKHCPKRHFKCMTLLNADDIVAAVG